jgi:methyl-accepting chemotaxis protein
MFNRITLSRRVWAVVGILWALLVALMWSSSSGLNDARASLKAVEARLAATNQLSHIEDSLLDNRLAVLLAFQHNPAGELAKLHDHPVTAHLQAIASSRASITETWARYVAGLEREDERALAAEVEARRKVWLGKLDAVTAAIGAGDYGTDKMQAFLVAGRTDGAAVVSAVDTLKKFQEARANEAAAQAEVRYQQALLLFAAVFVFGVLPSVVLTLLVLRRLTRGFASAQAAAHAIAEGELTRPVTVDGGDELGQLLSEMSAMRESLVAIIEEVRAGADDIASASSQVALGTQDLASRTERQASSVQQTAAAVEQLDSSVKQNAAHASSADQCAVQATDVAAKGGAAVDAVVHTMKDIDGSSRKVAEIVTLIDDISFQTNILALNASVEAARAGVHGQGFAVVAAEVRSLAQRSAESAREIRKLIDASVRRVAVGSEEVARAGETIREVVSSIQTVTRFVADIATSTREQSAGLTQISDAVVSMEGNTQQNAALVEQTSAASTALSEQAQRLAQVVGRFHLS